MATPSKRRNLESDSVKKPPVVRKKFMSMDAYTRHKFLISHYRLNAVGSTQMLERDTSKDKTDADVLREYHKFLWDDEEEDEEAESNELNGSKDEQWGRKLAKAYYDKLFKEFCICDLTRYKENKVAMRWRTEKEVVDGKGQFACGNKHCTESEELKSWEVNFGYVEEGTKKNALVKLRLCSRCSKKLNYNHKKKEVKRRERKSSAERRDANDGDEEIRDEASSSKRKSSSRHRNMEEYLSDLLQ